MDRNALLLRLRSDRYTSGEQLAAELGVTRAAIAKAVAALRRQGFRIDAVRNRGYLLREKPNVLCAEEIRAGLAGHPWAERVLVFPCVDSTNQVLRQLALDGAPEGAVVLADAQTAGRGRMGRQFLSLPGVGLYLSVLLRPARPAEALLSLTAQAALAAARAVETVCGVAPSIKWVNDLMLEGRKICGILTELSIEAESATVRYAILGVGVNCAQPEGGFPEPLQQIAGSIAGLTGVPVDRNALAAELIRRLSALPSDDWYDDYRQRCGTLGRPIYVLNTSGRRAGFALDLGPQAELRVRYEDGSEEWLRSGEVSIQSQAEQ